MSILSAFTTQLCNFFDELCSAFPEERDIRMACEAIKGAKKINPRLLLDLFKEHVYSNGAAEAIYQKDVDTMRHYAQQKLASHYNEMSSALSLFDKHWEGMSENNKNTIWQYLTVLCRLSEKMRD
jgi:hypothetical protein